MHCVQALPAIFIFEGDSVRKLPDWEMSNMLVGPFLFFFLALCMRVHAWNWRNMAASRGARARAQSECYHMRAITSCARRCLQGACLLALLSIVREPVKIARWRATAETLSYRAATG